MPAPTKNTFQRRLAAHRRSCSARPPRRAHWRSHADPTPSPPCHAPSASRAKVLGHQHRRFNMHVSIDKARQPKCLRGFIHVANGYYFPCGKSPPPPPAAPPGTAIHNIPDDSPCRHYNTPENPRMPQTHAPNDDAGADPASTIIPAARDEYAAPSAQPSGCPASAAAISCS